MKRTILLSIVGSVALLHSPVSSQQLQLDVSGGHIIGIGKGSYYVPAAELCTGASSGDVSSFIGQGVPNFPTVSADSLNLSTYFARDGVQNDDWDVDLGLWWDRNGPNPDFFLFEIGGNDYPTVRPILPGGQVGQPTSLSGWTPTGHSAPGGLNKGQQVYGLSFKLTDLKNANGQSLSAGASIKGLRFENKFIDGAAFCAVDPTPPPLGPLMRNPVFPIGPARTWQPFTVLVRGLNTNELGTGPNPFLDFKLQVRFTGPSGQVYDVPGYYNARGMLGSYGDVWKVVFTPDEPGDWSMKVSFRQGTNVAINLSPTAGTPISFVDGYTAPVNVLPVDSNAQGFERWGRLDYVGGHYLKFVDGPYFLKSGTDSPENLLSYSGIDHPQNGCNLGIVHTYGPHVADWGQGDPLFVGSATGSDSRGIIGALNYLADHGVNSVYLLLMNLGGDGNDVFPFVGSGGSSFENRHYDVSKLEQWDIVFRHAQRKGIMIHMVLGETEPANETWLDNGNLGVERKLYYREMVARYSHLLALKWNLSEENDFSASQLDSFADYIRAVDPYDHPVCVHPHLNSFSTYNQIYGDQRYSTSSMQYASNNAGSYTEQLRNQSASAGQPWVVDMDENGTASVGVSDSNINDMRKRVLYDVYFSGGNIEWYLGAAALPLGGDQDLEDFSTREPLWDYTAYARQLLETLPFWEMQPCDWLLTGESGSYGGGEVFAKHGDVYAVYLPDGNPSGTLNLNGASGPMLFKWFNPRVGTYQGNPRQIQGGGSVPLGSPPNSVNEDWVAVIKKL